MSGRLGAAVIAAFFIAFSLVFSGPALAAPKTYTSPPDAKPKSETELQRQLQETSYARGGYYIAMEGLYTLEQSSRLSGTQSSGGFDIRLGHRHNRWLATELYGLYVANFAGIRNNWYAWGLSANENLYLTKGRVQPFLSAGVGFVQVRLSFDRNVIVCAGRFCVDDGVGLTPGFVARFGGGFEINFTETFALTLIGSYHLTTGSIKDHDFITAGVGFRFF
jgi:opacity protein-like surface antigen